MEITLVDSPSQDYPYSAELKWLMLLVVAIAIQYVVTVYAITMRTRIKVFRRHFMKQFAAVHEKAFPGKKPPQYGYPDCGNGYFGKRLPYADWFRMNNAQRVQGNFLEQITFITGVSIVASLVYFNYAMYLFVTYQVGRLIFSVCYSLSGPNARIFGALLMDLAIFA